MSKAVDQPLVLTPGPSLICRNYLLISHGLALIACYANTLPIVLKLVLFIMICSSLWFSLQTYIFNLQSHSVKYSAATQWQLALAGQDYFSVRLLGSSVSTPYFVLLHLVDKKKKYFQIIFKDAISAEDYRQLRVRLTICS